MCALSVVEKKREGKPLFRRRDFTVASFWREGKQVGWIGSFRSHSTFSEYYLQMKWRKIINVSVVLCVISECCAKKRSFVTVKRRETFHDSALNVQGEFGDNGIACCTSTSRNECGPWTNVDPLYGKLFWKRKLLPTYRPCFLRLCYRKHNSFSSRPYNDQIHLWMGSHSWTQLDDLADGYPSFPAVCIYILT